MFENTFLICSKNISLYNSVEVHSFRSIIIFFRICLLLIFNNKKWQFTRSVWWFRKCAGLPVETLLHAEGHIYLHPLSSKILPSKHPRNNTRVFFTKWSQVNMSLTASTPLWLWLSWWWGFFFLLNYFAKNIIIKTQLVLSAFQVFFGMKILVLGYFLRHDLGQIRSSHMLFYCSPWMCCWHFNEIVALWSLTCRKVKIIHKIRQKLNSY